MTNPPSPSASQNPPRPFRRGGLWLFALLLVSLALAAATAYTYRNAEIFARERLVRGAVLYTQALESGARHFARGQRDLIIEYLAEATGEEVRGGALVNQDGQVLARVGDLPLADFHRAAWVQDATVRRVVSAGPQIGDTIWIAVPTSLGSRRGFGGRGREHRPGRGRGWGRQQYESRHIDRDLALVLAMDTTAANEPIRDAQIQALFVAAALIFAWLLAWRWHRTTIRAQRLEAQARRREKLAALGEMAAVLAHEIRNPLGAIRGHAQLAAKHLDDDSRAARSLETVVDETSRLSQLVESLLRYARPKPIEREPVQLGGLVDQVIELLGSSDLASDVALERDGDGEGPVVSCDRSQIEQVLLNLAQNALEAQQDGGRVTLSAAVDGADAIVRVDDAGPGVTADVRADIFEPFVTTRAEGSGLGLAIARQIAEGHGGSLTLEESPLGGAAFVLRLPLEESQP